MAKKDVVSLKYLMCSQEAEEIFDRGETVSLKYLMCSRESGELEVEDAVALKYAIPIRPGQWRSS